MNAVEFKEKLDKSRENDVVEFLKKYEEKWGEPLGSTVDKILERHANNKDTQEPLKINEINYKLLVEQGEWETIDQIPDIKLTPLPSHEELLYRGDKYDYKHEIYISYVKRKWFGHKAIHTGEFHRRVHQKEEHLSYNYLSPLQRGCFKKILIDRGFFVGENVFESLLYVYWNKEQYDSAMK